MCRHLGPSETPLDFSYEGVVEATTANGRSTLTINLTLPNLIALQLVTVSLQYADDMPTVGKIVAGE